MSLEKKLADISTKCSSHHQAESEKLPINIAFIAIYYRGYSSLEVNGRCRFLLSPCFIIVVQQPGTSSPPSRLKRSSVGIIWMGRAFINSSCPLPWPSTVVSSMAGEPWQRTRAVCEGGPAHPDDTHRGAF